MSKEKFSKVEWLLYFIVGTVLCIFGLMLGLLL